MVDENHEFYTYIIDKIPAIKLSEWSLSMSAEVVEGIHSNPLFALCDGEVLILAILMEIVSSFMDEAAIFHPLYDFTESSSCMAFASAKTLLIRQIMF